MSCPENIKRETVSLTLGELTGRRAFEAERHIAGCRECSSLRLALLAEKAFLKEGGMPLLAAGPGFAGMVTRAAAEKKASRRLAVGLSLAAGLAVLLFFAQPVKREPAAFDGPSLTAKFYNPYGARVPGEASPTDFFYCLSARSESGQGAGPKPLNLKEAL